MLNLNLCDLSGVSVSPLTVQCTDSNYRFIADICSGCKLSPKSFSQSFFPKGVAQSGNRVGGGAKQNNRVQLAAMCFSFKAGGNLSSEKEVQRMSDSK